MKILNQKQKNDAIYILIRILIVWARILPRGCGLALFAVLGRIVYLFPNHEKRRTLDHLRFIYGNAPPGFGDIKSMAAVVYADLGKNLFETIRLPTWTLRDLDRQVVHDDLTDFRRAYDLGKGVIVISGHIGCFDLLLRFFPLKGFRSFTVAQRLYDPRLDALVSEGLRTGDTVYLHRSDTRGVLKQLKDGRAMGVAIDQDTKVSGVFAHFLGKLAFTPSSAIKIAQHSGIPLFVSYTYRLKNGKHLVCVGTEVPLLRTENSDEDLVRNVEEVNRRLSAAIALAPTQWVWMHRRWATDVNNPAYSTIPNIEKL